jgi:hypothetical protein
MTHEKTEVLAKARVRFTIDVDLTIVNSPKALLEGEEENNDYPASIKDDRKYLLFQQKLLMAVLANPDTFQAVTVNEAGCEASTRFEERWISSNPEEHRMKSLIREIAQSCLTDEEWAEAKMAADEEDIVSDITHRLVDSWHSIPGDISIQMVVQQLN